MLDAKQKLQSVTDLQRPLLHHLNSDTSWLLQIPRNDGHRTFFNLLIDPWFVGPESVFSAWFHEDHHTGPSAIQTIAELEDSLREFETAARQLRHRCGHNDPGTDRPDSPSLIDAIAITLDGSDHAHKDTLLQVHPEVPVFALKRSANMISSWKHFQTVSTIPFFTSGKDWQTASLPLPSDGISISGLKEPGDKTHLHYGLLLTFGLQAQSGHESLVDRGAGVDEQDQQRIAAPNNATVEAIVYAPHGIASNDMAFLTSAKPTLRFLALLQGLHLVTFGLPFGGWNFDSNLGAHDALKTQRLLKAKYWFGTHDELKMEKGLTSYFLRRTPLTFEDALEHTLDKEELEAAPVGTDWAELGSGESRVLLG